MRRTYKGVVKNGVIVLEGDGHLPDGTKVTVIVEEKSAATKTVWDALAEIAGIFSSGLTDVSERKDEYVAEAYYRCGRSEPSNQEGQS
jgi:hypothetical protein